VKDYSGFILAAYGFATLIVGWLVVSIVLDHRDLKNRLARFGKSEEQK
jgi:heme exporter protein CcmD